MYWRNLFEASRFPNSFVRIVSTAKQFRTQAGSFDVETNFTNYELPLLKNSIDRHSDQRFNVSAAKSRSNRIKSCSLAIDRITGLFCVDTRSIYSISRFRSHRLVGPIVDIGPRRSAAKSPSTSHIYQILTEYKFLFTYRRGVQSFRFAIDAILHV